MRGPAVLQSWSSCRVHRVRTSSDECEMPLSSSVGSTSPSVASACLAGARAPSHSRLRTDERPRHADCAALRTDSLMSSTARMSRVCISVSEPATSSCVRPESSSASAMQLASRARHSRLMMPSSRWASTAGSCAASARFGSGTSDDHTCFIAWAMRGLGSNVYR